MKQLTLQTALYHCARTWGRMARTGELVSTSYGIKNDCFLCEYFCVGLYKNNKRRNGGCDNCKRIMKKIWLDGCMSTEGSIYMLWRQAPRKEEKRKFARQIANEAWTQWKLVRDE